MNDDACVTAEPEIELIQVETSSWIDI